MTPPDPTRLDPRALLRAARHGQALPRDAAARPHQPGAAPDDERGGLPRSVVRDRRAEGHHERVGHHRHVPRGAIAGYRLRPAAPLHGRDRRFLPLVGPVARRDRRGLRTRSAMRHGASVRRFAPTARSRRFSRRTAGPLASCSRTATSSTPTRWSRAPIRGSRSSTGSTRWSCRPTSARRASLQVPRLLWQGQPRARRPAELHLPAGRRAAPARRDFDLAQCRLHGTRLRRCRSTVGSRGGRTSTS